MPIRRLFVTLFLFFCTVSTPAVARLVEVTFSGATTSALAGGIRDRFPVGTSFAVRYTYDLSADPISGGSNSFAVYPLVSAALSLGDYPVLDVQALNHPSVIPFGVLQLFNQAAANSLDQVTFSVTQTPPATLPGIPVLLPGLGTVAVRPMGFAVQLDGLLLSSARLKPEAFPIDALNGAQLFVNFTTGATPGIPFSSGTHLSGIVTATSVLAVPEPSAVLMMLAGLCLITGALRVRSQRNGGGGRRLLSA